MKVLKQIYENMGEGINVLRDYRDFCKEQKFWLDGYAKFMHLKEGEEENFYRFIDAAYEAGVGTSLYSKNMCYFGMALNYDLDFLNYLYPDTIGMNVIDARKFILKECYNEEVEQRNKKKIGLI